MINNQKLDSDTVIGQSLKLFAFLNLPLYEDLKGVQSL